jgi:hypothetical protein
MAIDAEPKSVLSLTSCWLREKGAITPCVQHLENLRRKGHRRWKARSILVVGLALLVASAAALVDGNVEEVIRWPSHRHC